MKRLLIIVLLALTFNQLRAQDSLGTHIDYMVSAETAIGSGDYTAYQLATNRFSTLGTRSNTANMRAEMDLAHRFSEKYILTAKVDGIASLHSDHKAYLQQCFVNMRLNHFFVEAGTREIAPVLRDMRLSSGSFVESGNAKPIPQVRLGTDGFWTVPYTKKWLEVYFDFSYGHYLDDGYVEDKAEEYALSSGSGSSYTDNRWYHHKQLYFRSNSTKPLFFMVGCNHVVQFGGTFHPLNYTATGIAKYDLTPRLKDFFEVIIPQSDDGNGEWISGNHVGTLTFQIGWNINKEHQVQAYLDNIFEDGSGIRKGNGWDGIWGLEYRNKAKGVQYIRGIVAEYVQTTYQSGYIHWDHNDYQYPYNSISEMQELVTGNDNYYNNYFYQSYSHYGMAQGNALLTSPIYNKDGLNEFKDNSVKAYHLAVEGDISYGKYGYFGYLVKGSYRRGWGTHFHPFSKKSHSFDAVMQIDWKRGAWKASAAYAFDRGNIYSNTNTIDLTIAYHGKIL